MSILRLLERRGSFTILIAALVLPLMFFLFSLSVDLSMYHSESQKAQKAADDAALYAYRFLPFAAQAASAAESYLQRYEQLSKGAQVVTDNQSVSIKVRSEVALHFASLFGVDLQIPVEAYASVWSSPLDALVLLDSSAHSAPAPLLSGAWGTSSEWPAAYFFSNIKRFYEGGVALDDRAVTQQCFNPVLSNLKLAAIRTYDYLSAGHLNGVGVGFYPGNLTALDLAREVLPGGERSAQLGEADFVQVNASDYAADQYCAAAALLEPAHQEYLMPVAPAAIGGGFSPDPGTEQMLDPGNWSFNPAFQPFLQTRQVIWSRAAQNSESGNFPGVLQQARSLLFGSAVRTERAALSGKTRKALFVYSSDLPFYNGERFPGLYNSVQHELTSAFSKVRADIESFKQKLSIYYVVLRHENEPAGMDQAIQGLAEFFASQELDQFGNKLVDFDVRLFQASDASELSSSVISNLLLDKRSGVVRR